MVSRRYIFIILILVGLTSRAQIGGESTYRFLELPNSARIAALGGNQIALNDSTDLNLPFLNPALLAREMDNQILVNYVSYFADIKYGYASYARSFDSTGNFALGIHYINYGDFTETTETGEITGNQFQAAEYAFNIMYSNNYGRIRYGATLKPIYSVFESYRSFGLAADIGACYSNASGLSTVALAVRDFGTQITTYYENGEKEPLPFNLELGYSRRLAHAPVMFSITAQHLNHWDLAYEKEETESDDDDEIDLYSRGESVTKQLMRHLVLGVELLPSKNFTLRAGYNFQRRQELMLEDYPSTVGFSFGFGIKVKRFRLDYGISRFHLAGSSNLFSLAINLNEKY